MSSPLGFLFTIQLSLAGTAVLLPSPASAAVTPATVQFSAANYRVSEAATLARISLVRSGPLNQAVTVECRTDGGTATEGSDYAGVVTNITLAAGKAGATVVVPLRSDTINEPAETVGLMLSGAVVGARSSAVLTIVDNDAAGIISFGKSAFSVNETAVTGVVQLVRAGGTASETSVMLVSSDGTAIENADYTPVSTRVVFGANERSKTVPITIADDNHPEGNETVKLQLSKPDGGAKLGALTNTTLTIVDDEIALSFSRAAYPAPERNGTALITILRSGPLKQAVTVKLSTTQGGTAIPVVEYKPITNQILTFPAGVAAKTIALAIKDDTLDDDDKTVELELTDPSAPAQLGTIQMTVVTLVDNDAGGTINFTAPTYNTTETAVKAPVMVRRTGGRASNVTVQLRTSDGTATAGEDYREVVTNLTFKSGELVKTVFIPILNDAMVEDTETVNLHLSDATGGAALGTNTQAVLRIANDDRGGAIQFSSTSYTVSENGTNAVITLTRTSGLAAGVQVEIVATGGTATDGNDYTGLPAVADFLPGAVSTKVLVPVIDDADIEGPETIALRLQNPTGGATLGLRTNATLGIADDERFVLGSYRGTLSYAFTGCIDRSDNETGTMSCDLNVTDQTSDSFVAFAALIGAQCENRTVLAFVGQIGPNGDVSGTFRDEGDTLGAISGKIGNGSIQLTIDGQPGSDGCRVRASFTGKLYAPSTSGFAPVVLTGLMMETTQSGEKGQIEYRTNNRFNRRDSGGDVSTALYLYTKTGANTGTMRTSEGEENAVISIVFTSPTQGRYTRINCKGKSGSGTFVIGDYPVPDPTPVYQVWGGDSFTTTEPQWWKKGEYPGEYGYVLLGSADVTSTFNGNYPFFIIRTPPGFSFTVDTVEGSDGTYFGATSSGDTDDWWNLGGPPDGVGAILGSANSSGSAFIVIDARGHDLSWMKVYLTP